MNRTSLRYRSIALLAAGVFLATMWGDALGAHKCPHHDLLPDVSGEAPAGGHASAHAHAPAPETGSPDRHGGHGPCTCIGHCNASSTAAVSRPVSAIRTVAARAEFRPRVFEATTPRPNRLPFSLPFANAPPVSFAA